MSDLSMQLALPSSAQAIVELRDGIARWQIEHDIEQWSPGELTVREVTDQLRQGEWWIDGNDDRPRAAVRITESDSTTWLEDDVSAGYVHGLMVNRRAAGGGLGTSILHWAEREISARGPAFARLDCVATNTVLRSYYRKHGFAECGITTFSQGSGWLPVMRFEKQLF